MSQRRPSSSKPAAAIPSPSSSILLLNPTNDVLLLHRVRTSSSFASAHVFPGGNLDAFHDGDIPAPDAPERHVDGPAYRLGAIRECFEETGILLAKKEDGSLVNLAEDERNAARKKVHGNQVKFLDWVKSVGGVPDTAGLVPFTRWLTPNNVPKRFTTQMYLYLLPISRSSVPAEMHIPTADGGVEHTAALFAPASSFLKRADAGEIMLFPPQFFLLHLLARFFTGASASLEEGPLHFVAQRKKLLSFVRRVPAAETEKGKAHATAVIPWGDKVISPHVLFVSEKDGRSVLGLERPGPELKGSSRGGDWERVVLVRFGKGGPREVEVRRREDIFEEEKAKGTGEKL